MPGRRKSRAVFAASDLLIDVLIVVDGHSGQMLWDQSLVSPSIGGFPVRSLNFHLTYYEPLCPYEASWREELRYPLTHCVRNLFIFLWGKSWCHTEISPFIVLLHRTVRWCYYIKLWMRTFECHVDGSTVCLIKKWTVFLVVYRAVPRITHLAFVKRRIGLWRKQVSGCSWAAVWVTQACCSVL